MYKDVGKKLMSLSKVIGWIFFIICLLLWLIYLTNGESSDNWMAWSFFVGGLIGLASTWPMYAFGQLVDDIHEMKQSAQKTAPAPAAAPVIMELPDL